MGQTAYSDDRDFVYQDAEKWEVLITMPEDDRAMHKARDSVAKSNIYRNAIKKADDDWQNLEHIFLSLDELQDDLAEQIISKLFEEIQSQKVFISSQAELTDYLKKYPDLIQVVRFACEKAREEFEFPNQLVLDVFYDPESDDRYPTLYVRQESYNKDILDRIDAVSEEFDSLLAESKGWFLITSDFANPK